MFPLMCDIYQLTETSLNGEPEDTATILHTGVPCGWVRMSGNLRYLAAGIGVALSRRLATEYFPDVDDRCEVRNLRTREGTPLAGEAPRYRIVYAEGKQRGFHLEMDLEAWKP